MNKKLFAGAFALAAVLVAGSVSAAYTFPNKIDTKQEKKDVQSVLNMNGASLTVDGVFGAKTTAAVKAFQTSKKLTADGLIGPMTRAALEAAQVAGSTTGSTSTGTVTTPVATGTTDGSLTASTSSYVSSSITIKKGETKDIAAVRLQATAGPVKVTRADVNFNVRPWLFFGSVSLHDSTGKVLATKTLSSINDTTEVTVGTSYNVRFEGLSYTVTPGTNPDLAVSASVLSATDKIVGTQAVVAGITSIRTINEIGYADTVTYAGTNSVSLASTGSVAALYTRISPISPAEGQQVVSATQATNDVVLGAFSVKSTNNSSTLNTVKIGVTGTLSVATESALSNFRLYVNGANIGGGTLNATTKVVTFSNLTAPLAQDAWTDMVVKADIAQNITGTVALSMNAYTAQNSGLAADVVVTDANYGTPDYSNNGARATNTLTLTVNSIAISNAVATLGSSIVQNNYTVGYNATYGFTLANNSNNDLYVSATPSTFVTFTKTGTGTSSVSAVNTTVTPSTVNGDTVSVYAIAAGTSRTFSFPVAIYGTTGSNVNVKATAVNYSAATNLSPSTAITTGLSSLSVTANF